MLFLQFSAGGVCNWGILLVISLEFQGNKASTVFYDTAFKKRAEKTKHVRKPFHTFLRCFSPPAHPTNNPAPHPPYGHAPASNRSSPRMWGCHYSRRVRRGGHQVFLMHVGVPSSIWARSGHAAPPAAKPFTKVLGDGGGGGGRSLSSERFFLPLPNLHLPTPPQPQTWPAPIRAWRNGRS